MFCENCGKLLPGNALVCAACGFRLTELLPEEPEDFIIPYYPTTPVSGVVKTRPKACRVQTAHNITEQAPAAGFSLVADKNGYSLYLVSAADMVSISGVLNAWIADNGRVFYYTTADGLYRYNGSSQRIAVLNENELCDFVCSPDGSACAWVTCSDGEYKCHIFSSTDGIIAENR